MMSPVATALGKACLGWLILYVVLIFLYAYWNMDEAMILPSAAFPASQETIARSLVADSASKEEPWYATSAHQSLLQQTRDTIQEIQQAAKDTRSVESTVFLLANKMQKMQNEQTKNTKLFANRRSNDSLPILFSLLQQDDMSVSSLTQEKVDAAVAELDALLNRKTPINWRALRESWNRVKLPERRPRFICPSNHQRKKSRKDSLEEQLAQFRKDYEQAMEAARENKNIAGIPIHSRSRVTELTSMRESLLSSVTADVDSAASSSSQQCTPTTLAVQWLEAGLDALARGKEPRQAILRAMAEEGTIDLSEIILDADMSSSPTETRPERHTPTNFRQVLDGPWLSSAAQALNRGIDLVSGYIDPVDQWIDEKSRIHPDLGRAAVRVTLEAAGKIPLPPVLAKVWYGQ